MSEEQASWKKMGRPKMFNSPEEFEERADLYFKENEGEKISWTGLCLAVGAASRQGLDRYKKGEHGDDFVGPIKRALMVVENYYEEKAEGAKSIFILKNFEWKDNIDINADVNQTVTDLSEEELNKQIEDLYNKTQEEK